MMKAINFLCTKLQIGKTYVMEELKSLEDTQERMFIPSLNIFILSINLHIFNYIFTAPQFKTGFYHIKRKILYLIISFKRAMNLKHRYIGQ